MGNLTKVVVLYSDSFRILNSCIIFYRGNMRSNIEMNQGHMELPAGLSINTADENDFQDIISLLIECDLVTEDLSHESVKNFLVVRDQNINLVATIGIDLYSNIGLLRSLAVQEHYRNKGIANNLLNEVEKIAFEKKLRSLYLLTMSASEYFQKRNYVPIPRESVPLPIKESKQFLDLCPSSSLCMKKRLEHLLDL